MFNSIYLTGDKHNDFSKFIEYDKILDRNDCVIILGDVGLLFNKIPNVYDYKILNWLNSRPYKILFVDGNHENFDVLDNLKEIDFNGKPVGGLSDNIYHLKRGYIYTINDKKYFIFGGGYSIDKQYRTIGIDWWEREYFSDEESTRAYEELEENNWEVDCVLTHVAPESVFIYMYENFNLFSSGIIYDKVSDYLDVIMKKINIKEWYFGHYHYDIKSFKMPDYDITFRCLYHDLVKL